MLDAGIFTLGDEEEGEHPHFVGTDYDVGHRSIELFVSGKSALHEATNATIPAVASHARSWAFTGSGAT
jgi:hypothetical protein